MCFEIESDVNLVGPSKKELKQIVRDFYFVGFLSGIKAWKNILRIPVVLEN